MKKRFALLLILCMTLSLLSACGSKAPAEPPPEAPQEQTEAAPEEALTQEDPAPAPEGEPEAEDEPLQQEGFPVEGKYFTLWLPEEWKDLVVTEEHDSQDEGYFLSVYHKASHEAEDTGHLFTLTLDETTEFVTFPSYRVVGDLDGVVSYHLIALMPTDVQAAQGHEDEYFSLYNEDEFQEIFKHIQPKEGWTLNEMPEDQLRNAQVHFEYWNIMGGIYYANILPNGTEVIPSDWDGDMENNHFAVVDIDSDGIEELLVSVEDSYMAGMILEIYGLNPDSGLVEERLGIFPAATFFSNGMVQALNSHNHTFAEFWPYSLFRYLPDNGSYELIATVYGWDREISEVDYNDEPFPVDADKDGNGTIYSIRQNEEEHWVDDAEYQQWWDDQLSGAEVIEIPWQAITEENIDSIWSTPGND